MKFPPRFPTLGPVDVCLVAFALIGWPTQLNAQRPGGGHPPLHPLEQAIDLDGDGSLSAVEIKNAGQSLLRLDTNGDGRVSADESEPHGPGRGPDRGFGGPRSGGDFRPPLHPIGAQLDVNSDDVLDADELAAAAKRLLRMDDDGNGAITQAELHRQGFRGGPEGGPGRPGFGGPDEGFRESGTPAQPAAQSTANFEAVRRVMALDLDDDQRVSRAEVPENLVALLRADTNRDGFITRSEARAFVEHLRPSEPAGGNRRKRGF